MYNETAIFLCADGTQREFELRYIFEYKDKSYGILFQKLKGEWEVDGEVFIVADDEELDAENNYTVKEIIEPSDENLTIQYKDVAENEFYEVMKRAVAVLNGEDFVDDELPF